MFQATAEQSFTDLLNQDRATILFPVLHEVSLNEVCWSQTMIWTTFSYLL